MTSTLTRTLLWLFVINLGLAFGAGLYESRIVVPDWITATASGDMHWNAEAARRDDTGLRFWVFFSTVPLTLLTLLNLVSAARYSGAARRSWLGSVACAVAERLFTFGYFIPTMVGLMAAPDSQDSVQSALTWESLNYARHTLLLAGWLLAMRALVYLAAPSTPAARPAAAPSAPAVVLRN